MSEATGAGRCPGGWADPGETPAQAVAREIAEETGYTAVVRKLVGCWDRDVQGNTPPLPVHVYKLFFLCEAAGEPVEASVLETLDVGWFAVDDLPPLSLGRVTSRQIQRALAHRLDPGCPPSSIDPRRPADGGGPGKAHLARLRGLCSNGSVLIRMAAAGDAAALAALRWQWNAEHDAVPEPLDAFSERFALWMQQHDHSHEALLAIEDDTPIAMAWLASTDRLPDPGTEGSTVGEIQSVYLLPALRSAGRGSELMRAAIDRAASRGMGSVSVRPGRRSLPFYKRLGFEGADALLYLSLQL